MNLIAYQANIFHPQIEKIEELKVFSQFFKGLQNPWISLNDRSKQFTFPISTVVPDQFKIPAYNELNLSFDECAVNRAQEIINIQNKTGQQIRLLYSGGIDSTVVLISFINLLGIQEASKRIKIQMNQDSINENPEMWYKIISPNFEILDSNLSYNESDYGDWLYVTGELNDQLFGAEMQRDYEFWKGSGSLNDKIDLSNLINFFVECKKIDKKSALTLSTMLIDNLKTCPNHQNQMWDIFWWYNFSWKWIYVYFRFFLFFKNQSLIDLKWMSQNYFPFFDSTEFQLWSLNNKQEKHKGSWSSYKFPAKQMICNFLGSNFYMTKVKRNSLPKIIIARSKTNIITSNYEILSNLNFLDVYNQDNSIAYYEKNL